MAITLQRARQMFDLVNAKLCCPCNPAAPCITFLYPDDGCWGRAHEMCRLMLAAGESPRKIWISGYPLTVATRNNPGCQVVWGWHVAPTLDVAAGGGIQTYVIDPSLFNEPVTQTAWFNIQNNPNATLTPTGPEIFHLFSVADRLDPTYVKSNQVLTTYRNELMLRSASANGPPPYTNCMVRGTGVQWFGSIAPNTTHRWFTWGWPARWHVLWTIMPLTPCPNGPQLSWSVAVERASGTDCTYWITVKNLSGDAVKFEGRYNVLSF
jgi:Glutaminase